jgi:hypothetical protein
MKAACCATAKLKQLKENGSMRKIQIATLYLA